MAKLSSYNKMKAKYEAKISELTNDILDMLDEKDFIKSTMTKAKWHIKIDLEKAVWDGSVKK